MIATPSSLEPLTVSGINRRKITKNPILFANSLENICSHYYNMYKAIAAQASASAKACFISVEGSGGTRWVTGQGAWCSSG